MAAALVLSARYTYSTYLYIPSPKRVMGFFVSSVTPRETCKSAKSPT